MPLPLQNAAQGDYDNALLRKILQNAILSKGSSIGGIYPDVSADFRQFVRTYSAAGSQAAAASCTDYGVITGSATSLVYVTRIVVSGFETTAAAIRIALVKRAAANTSGTVVGLTAVPHFSTDAAAGAVANLYSANPTINSTVGNIEVRYMPLMATTTINSNGMVFDFGTTGKPILLSGIAEQLAINFNGVTLTGNALAARFEWYEI